MLNKTKQKELDDALMQAAENGDVSAARLLVQEGANPDVTRANGYCPVLNAVIRDKTAMLDYLLNEAQASPNCSLQGSQNAVDIAVNRNKLAAVKLLVDAGATLDYGRTNDFSPEQMATATGRTEIAAYFSVLAKQNESAARQKKAEDLTRQIRTINTTRSLQEGASEKIPVRKPFTVKRAPKK